MSTTPPPDKPAQHVKACRDLELPLFPVVAREKRPRDKDWQTREYTWDDVREWYNQGANLGVRITDDMVVLDIDPRRDPEGRTASEIWLDLTNGEGPDDAPTVSTGSGGWHVYFKGRPAGVRKAWGPALEVKLAGQLVVAPGSTHPNGERYLWGSLGPIPVLPAALAALLFQPADTRPKNVAELRTPEYVADSLALIDPTTKRDYEEWRNLLFACHSATGGSDEGLEVFIDWSIRDPQYVDAAENVRAIWQAARSGGRTAASLDHAVREAGHVPVCERVEMEEIPAAVPERMPKGAEGKPSSTSKRKPKMEMLKKVLIATGFEARRDVLTAEVRVSWPAMGLVDQQRDRTLESKILVTGLLEKAGVRWNPEPSPSVLRCVIDDLVVDVDPRKDWAEALVWDGEERMETWLLDICNLEDTRYHRGVSRYILEAGIARLRAPGTKADMVPVLTGPQGCGKSRFVDRMGLSRWAGTWQLEQMSTDGIRICHRAWILEIAELGAARFGRLEQLKDFLSRTHDEFRLPYDRDVTSRGRAFIFIGTTNDRRYLIDSTGNRRFLPVEVDTVDVDAMTDEYVEQLWAEAHAKYVPTPLVTIPRELWRDAAEAQESAYEVDPWEDVLATYLAANPGQHKAADLYEQALNRARTGCSRSDQMRIGRILARLGYERVEGGAFAIPQPKAARAEIEERLEAMGLPLTVTPAEFDFRGKRCDPRDVAAVLKDRGYQPKRNSTARWYEREEK